MDENNLSPKDVTLLIQAIKDGTSGAQEQLFVQLVEELRSAAGRLIRGEGRDHTLQATGLINEACKQLLEQNVLAHAACSDYLFAAAHRAMRQILIDYARTRNAQKRGGGQKRASLDYVINTVEEQSGRSFDEVHEALEVLGEQSPRQREVVEQKFYSGLAIDEIAVVMGVSTATVERDWRIAKAKLMEIMTRGDETSADHRPEA